MSEPYLGEIHMFGFDFAPRGYAFCDGQILPINQNEALFSLLGTTFGGDGRTSFGLPDLRGRVPTHPGTTISRGTKSGQETVTLSPAELPAHTHTVKASSDNASSSSPAGNVLARSGSNAYQDEPAPAVAMNSGVVSPTGNQGHENMQPYQVISFGIALRGLFPSRN